MVKSMDLLDAANPPLPTIRLMNDGGRVRPALSRETSEVLRRLVRQIADADFGGVQERTAEALGVKGATLSTFLSGKNRAGLQTQDGIVAYLRRSMDQILAANGDLATLRGGMTAPAQIAETRFTDLPNWPAMLAAAKDARPEVPAWAWDLCATARVLLDVPITPRFVADIAAAIHHNLAPPRGTENPPSADH